jgi:hypothetical protein
VIKHLLLTDCLVFYTQLIDRKAKSFRTELGVFLAAFFRRLGGNSSRDNILIFGFRAQTCTHFEFYWYILIEKVWTERPFLEVALLIVFVGLALEVTFLLDIFKRNGIEAA